MNSQEKNPVLAQTLRILIGEGVVALLTVGVYYLLDICSLVTFSYTVITGALLGAAVIVLNFFFLARSTDKIALEALAARGTREMSEEEIQKFTEEHTARMNNAVKLSFIIRMLSMLGALILALLSPWFDPIATLVPLLMLRPVITVSELIRRKEESDAA